MARTAWPDLPLWQRTATGMLAAVEVVLTVTAAIDLARRPANQVHGSKAVWWPLIVIQPVGPVLYLGWGRRRQGSVATSYGPGKPGRLPLGRVRSRRRA